MTTTPTTWPFVESPGDFAKRLERAIWSFSGDTLAAVRNVLIENPPTFATPAEIAQPATPEPVARSDFDKLSADLTRAKNLLVRLWDKYPEARAQIEGSTGSWFVLGQDRATQASAPSAQMPTEAAIEACMSFARDLRNHDTVRMTAAKCADAIRRAASGRHPGAPLDPS